MCLGIPGKVLEVHEVRGTPMATIDFGGVTKEVCLAFVPEVVVGDYAIVHAGFAITRLDEESALETLRTISELGMLEAELGDGASPDRPSPDRPSPDRPSPGPAGGAGAVAPA